MVSKQGLRKREIEKPTAIIDILGVLARVNYPGIEF
jgi:hypothetical protein